MLSDVQCQIQDLRGFHWPEKMAIQRHRLLWDLGIALHLQELLEEHIASLPPKKLSVRLGLRCVSDFSGCRVEYDGLLTGLPDWVMT